MSCDDVPRFPRPLITSDRLDLIDRLASRGKQLATALILIIETRLQFDSLSLEPRSISSIENTFRLGYIGKPQCFADFDLRSLDIRLQLISFGNVEELSGDLGQRGNAKERCHPPFLLVVNCQRLGKRAFSLFVRLRIQPRPSRDVRDLWRRPERDH